MNTILPVKEVIQEAVNYCLQSKCPNVYPTFRLLEQGLYGLIFSDSNSKEPVTEVFYDLGIDTTINQATTLLEFISVLDTNTGYVIYYANPNLDNVLIAMDNIIVLVPKALFITPMGKVVEQQCIADTHAYTTQVMHKIATEAFGQQVLPTPNSLPKITPTEYKPTNLSITNAVFVETIVDFYNDCNGAKLILVNNNINSAASEKDSAKLIINIVTNRAIHIPPTIWTQSKVVQYLLKQQDTNWYVTEFIPLT